MKIQTKFAKEKILNKKGLNHILVEVIPEKIACKEKKTNLIIYAIDKSSSMNACVSNNLHELTSKMDYAKDSMIKSLESLNNEDKVGVVTFNSTAYVSCPIQYVSNKDIVVKEINNIIPRGCTNISDALDKSLEMILKEEDKDKYNCKIIVLSDGIANEGITNEDGLATLSKKCLDNGVTISALGLGLEYNASIMGAIAKGGGGLFYHINNLGKLSSIFKEELELSSSVLAKNVKLYINTPSLIEIKDNLNNYPQSLDSLNNDRIEVSLGDIYSNKKVVFEINNSFRNENIYFKIELEYFDLNDSKNKISKEIMLEVTESKEDYDKAAEEKDVISYVLSLQKNSAILNATSSLDKGDYVNVKDIFSNIDSKLDKLSSCYTSSNNLCCDSKSEINLISNKYISNKLDKDELNSMYEKSYKSTR